MDGDAGLSETIEELRAQLAAREAELEAARAALQTKDDLIKSLKLKLAKLQRMQFGASSEKRAREIAQLELALEDLEASAAAAMAMTGVREPRTPRSGRRPLPETLPREAVVHRPSETCAQCGGELRYLGEDVSEVLEYVPARFKVVRHVRPKLSCRCCEAIAQAPAPSLPITGGKAGPGMLAHVLISKYMDHCPLYRQSEIYGREGVDLARSTMASWVGQAAHLIDPLIDVIAEHVMAGETLHGDDTVVPVLDPGRGKTKTGRFWVYARDERPHGSKAPPAVLFRYSPDRRGVHPQEHLKDFAGFLHADAYSGFKELYRTQRISEAACWAHVRRKFNDVAKDAGSPLADEALARIGALYAIEKEIKGRLPDERMAVRRARAGPLLADMHDWLEKTLPKLSRKMEPAKTMRHALSRWAALNRYIDDGRLEIDNNCAERALRGVALGRKNFMFVGSDAGGERAAAIYTLLGTAKLNGVNPQHYLAHVLDVIADHPINKIDELLPWNWREQGADDKLAA